MLVTIVVLTTVAWVLFVPAADWLATHDVGQVTGPLRTLRLQTARDAARGRLLTLGAGLFAAGALWFTARNFLLSRRGVELTEQAQQRTFELTEQGQVTDRYTRAIEQLGSEMLDVRIGGIYALERIARDSARDHPTVMEVLAAFIREHSREQWPEPDAETHERTTRPDVQAAITVIGRRDPNRDRGQINLARVNLTGADIRKADLARTTFYQADLTGVVLLGANVPGAVFYQADLTGVVLLGANVPGAVFYQADLTRSIFVDANLTGANLRSVTLIDAHLGGADPTRAEVEDADLTRADLSRANLTGVNLADANLTGANLFRVIANAAFSRANLTGAKLVEADLRGADFGDSILARADLLRANLTGANLTAADLTGADLLVTNFTDAVLTNTDLTRADLTGAVLKGAELTGATFSQDSPTPPGWERDPSTGRLRRMT
jgi:uncharacterized protein YjbI with pentapeptide repeats